MKVSKDGMRVQYEDSDYAHLTLEQVLESIHQENERKRKATAGEDDTNTGEKPLGLEH